MRDGQEIVNRRIEQFGVSQMNVVFSFWINFKPGTENKNNTIKQWRIFGR